MAGTLIHFVRLSVKVRKKGGRLWAKPGVLLSVLFLCGE